MYPTDEELTQLVYNYYGYVRYLTVTRDSDDTMDEMVVAPESLNQDNVLPDSASANSESDIKAELSTWMIADNITGTQVIDVFLLRDKIEAALKDNKYLASNELGLLMDADKRLYHFLQTHQRAMRKMVDIWRSYYPTTAEDNWWWYGDEYIFRTPTGVTHEPRMDVWLFFGILFVVFSLLFMSYTAQGLLQRQLSLEAVLSIVANILWGGALATPPGLDFSRAFVRMTTNIPATVWSWLQWIMNKASGKSHIWRMPSPPSQNSFTFFAFSTLVLTFSLFLPMVVLPLASTFVYQRGQDALEVYDYGAALELFTLSARLQPTALPGITQADAAAQLTQLGQLYEGIGIPEQARLAYERALEKDSRIIVAQVALANLYVDIGEYPSALALASQAIDEAQAFMEGRIALPTNQETANLLLYRAYVIRGRIMLNTDFTSAAIRNFESAEAIINDVERDAYDIANLNRLFAFARIEFMYERDLNEAQCNDQIGDIRNNLDIVANTISQIREASPYYIWDADIQEISLWELSFDCSLPNGGVSEWPIRGTY